MPQREVLSHLCEQLPRKARIETPPPQLPGKALSHSVRAARAGRGSARCPPPPAPPARSESRDNFVGYKSCAPRASRASASFLCVAVSFPETCDPALVSVRNEARASQHRFFLPQAGPGSAEAVTG